MKNNGMVLDVRNKANRKKALYKARCKHCEEMIRTLGDGTLWSHLGKNGETCPGSREEP